MKKLLTAWGSLMALMAVAGILVAVGLAEPVQADEPKQAKTEKTETKKVAQINDYTYTANDGDSYSAMVRKAVQTYGIVNGIDLGTARIIYIETMMSQDSANPYLWVGQKMTIKGSDVKKWVDKSLKLGNQDLAAWQTYAPYVNFNTDSVGE